MIALRGDRVVGCCSCRMTFPRYAAAAARCVASGVDDTVFAVSALPCDFQIAEFIEVEGDVKVHEGFNVTGAFSD